MNKQSGSILLMVLLIMAGAMLSTTALLRSAQLLKQSVYFYEQSACIHAVVQEVQQYAIQVVKNNFEQLKKHDAKIVNGSLAQTWQQWPGDTRYQASVQLQPQDSEVKIIVSVSNGAINKKLGCMVALESKKPQEGRATDKKNWIIQPFKL